MGLDLDNVKLTREKICFWNEVNEKVGRDFCCEYLPSHWCVNANEAGRQNVGTLTWWLQPTIDLSANVHFYKPFIIGSWFLIVNDDNLLWDKNLPEPCYKFAGTQWNLPEQTSWMLVFLYALDRFLLWTGMIMRISPVNWYFRTKCPVCLYRCTL